MGYLLTCRTNVSHSFISSLQKLTGQKATPDHAAVLLEKRFSNLAPRKETIVLLVDEVRTIFKEEIFSAYPYHSHGGPEVIPATVE